MKELKILPMYFREVECGNKTFELRLNDLDFCVNDELLLREYDFSGYTGRAIKAKVTYILYLNGFIDIDKDWVILSIRVLRTWEKYDS